MANLGYFNNDKKEYVIENMRPRRPLKNFIWNEKLILILDHFGFGESSSLFVASIGFSIYCESCARLYKTPSTILSVCTLIPLVPGYGVYNTLYAFLRKDYVQAIDFGTVTISNACALALGIIFISTLYRNRNLNKIKELKNKLNSI